jgi:L-lactate dehydrogenase complex protein LldG
VSLRAAADRKLWGDFTARAEALGTTVLRADSEETAAKLLTGAPALTLTGSVRARYPGLVRALEWADGGAEVAAAAEFAVAETGSLALNEPRADRGACFLADRLWLLVPGDQVVAGLDEAFTRLGQLIQQGGRHPLLMSGPSRTADIERVLTVGVHGPRALVAVIVDTSVR